MSKNEQQFGGFDYSFIDSPDDELVCSICLLVQREPVLTSCCGNHFCRSCIEAIGAQQLPCPLCNASKFSTMVDKYFARKVNVLRVHCPHAHKGCTWEGNLGSLSSHLDVDTVSESCEFLLIACPNLCGRKVPTIELDEHNKVCPRRQHICKFCGYVGVYEDMSAKHWTVCENYPLPCPNKCGELSIQRKEMRIHREQDCPLELVKCEFEYGGCETSLLRKDMSDHISKQVHYHLSLVSKRCAQLLKQFPPDFQQAIHQQLRSKDTEIHQMKIQLQQRERDIDQLRIQLHSVEEELNDVKSDCLSLKSTVFIPPAEFVMTDFLKYKQEEVQWLSPPFYSHLGGYCLCLSVDANGSEDGSGTHMSVYVNIMKGEFDQYLRWPFRGNIKVLLCNQRRSEGSIEENIFFEYDTPPEVAGRVVHGEVAESGLGIPKFIEQSKLGYDPSKNTEYLKNNCLYLKVENVTVTV